MAPEYILWGCFGAPPAPLGIWSANSLHAKTGGGGGPATPRRTPNFDFALAAALIGARLEFEDLKNVVGNEVAAIDRFSTVHTGDAQLSRTVVCVVR
jgi:hypothetical protein